MIIFAVYVWSPTTWEEFLNVMTTRDSERGWTARREAQTATASVARRSRASPDFLGRTSGRGCTIRTSPAGRPRIRLQTSTQNNKRITSYPGSGIFRVRPDLYGKVEIHTNWHTHPANASNKLEPSRQDRKFKSTQSENGVKRFIILTGGHPPFEY